MVWQDPADGPYSSRRSNDAVQGYLANLDESHRSARRIDDKMVKYVLICIDQKRILPGERNRNSWRGKLFNVEKR